MGTRGRPTAFLAEVIDEIAADFRLNVLHAGTVEPELVADTSTEVGRAARTLLGFVYASSEYPGRQGRSGNDRWRRNKEE